MNLFRNHLWFYIFFISFVFASFGNAQEFRLRAHHVYWKNQEANTEREIDFGRTVPSSRKIGYLPSIFADKLRPKLISRSVFAS